MKILSVKQHGELRKFKFFIRVDGKSYMSEDHYIFKLAMVRFQKSFSKPLEIAMKKYEDEYVNDFTLTAKATCFPYGSTVTIDCSANWSKWIRLTNHEPASIVVQVLMNVNIEVIINKIPNSTATKLYKDETHTDFQLSAEDGSVAVHRAQLAIQSDMFDTMFQGKWKETAQGRVELKGVTQQNLQDFKDFIYLRTLPDDWLRLYQLLMLATQYLVDSLKPMCIMKLIQKITAENLDTLLQFAVDNKMHDLKDSILENVPEEVFAAACAIKINAMMGEQGEDS